MSLCVHRRRNYHKKLQNFSTLNTGLLAYRAIRSAINSYIIEPFFKTNPSTMLVNYEANKYV